MNMDKREKKIRKIQKIYERESNCGIEERELCNTPILANTLFPTSSFRHRINALYVFHMSNAA